MTDQGNSSQPRPASKAAQAVAAMREERALSLEALAGLTDEELATRIEWRGGQQSVNARVIGFGTHMIDHQQHLLRLLFARGRGLTAAELLWVKNAVLTAELEAMALVLGDADFIAQGPEAGDWSADQILGHVIKAERSYREKVLAGLEAAKAAAAADGTGA